MAMDKEALQKIAKLGKQNIWSIFEAVRGKRKDWVTFTTF